MTATPRLPAAAVEGGWQVRIGGAAGGCVREEDILATVAEPEGALRLTTAFLQYYRENAEYRERTYDLVPRVGLDRICAAVLDPQTAAGLRERLAIAKAAAQGPWLERDAPYHPSQFTDLDDAHQNSEIDLRELAMVGPPQAGRP